MRCKPLKFVYLNCLQIVMKTPLLYLIMFFLTLGVAVNPAQAQTGASRARVYQLLKTGNADEIDAELAKLNDSQLSQKTGYEAALLMKKAGLLKKAKEKLKTFKDGRIKMETTIAANPDDTELHFLRLIIEENAPHVVKYKADLPADREIVIKHRHDMSQAAQEALADYAKTSKIIHPSDL